MYTDSIAKRYVTIISIMCVLVSIFVGGGIIKAIRVVVFWEV